MAWGNFVLDKGRRSESAISKFYAVKVGTNPEYITAVAANTDDIAGFAQFGITSDELARGKDCSVRFIGVTEAVAVGAIHYGKWVTLEADGRVSELVGSSGKTVVGKCVGNPAVNANDRIALLIVHTLAKA